MFKVTSENNSGHVNDGIRNCWHYCYHVILSDQYTGTPLTDDYCMSRKTPTVCYITEPVSQPKTNKLNQFEIQQRILGLHFVLHCNTLYLLCQHEWL